MDIENTHPIPPQVPADEPDTYNPSLDLPNYIYPNIELLENYNDSVIIDAETLEVNKNKIIETFNYSQIEITTIRAILGPSFTLYEFIPATGTRVLKIKSLKDDLALNLAAEINITGPIPGMGTMVIEIPHSIPLYGFNSLGIGDSKTPSV